MSDSMPESSVVPEEKDGDTPDVTGLGSEQGSSSGADPSANIRLKALSTVLSEARMCVTENLNADKRTAHL